VNNDPLTSRVAMMAFIQALRREWVGMHPRTTAPCPVPMWKDMEPDVQFHFVKCMKVALAAATAENVQRVISEETIRDSKES
jgi:hypothetical protein